MAAATPRAASGSYAAADLLFPATVVCSCSKRFVSDWSESNAIEPCQMSAVWLFLEHQASHLMATRQWPKKPHSAISLMMRCIACKDCFDINHYGQHLRRSHGSVDPARMYRDRRTIDCGDSSSIPRFECVDCVQRDKFRRLSIASLAQHYVQHDIPNTYELYLNCTECQCRVPLRDAVGHAAFCVQVASDALDGALKPSNLADCFVTEPISARDAVSDTASDRVAAATDGQRVDFGPAVSSPPTVHRDDQSRVSPRKSGENLSHRCTRCSKPFLSRTELIWHFNRHHPPKSASLRSAAFTDPQYVLGSTAGRAKLELRKDKLGFMHSIQVQPSRFARIVHPDKRYSIDGPTTEAPATESKSAGTSQQVIDEQEQDVECHYCGERFPRRSELHLHENEAHSEELRRARIATTKYTKPIERQKPKLKRPKKFVASQSQCSYCDKDFPSPSFCYVHVMEEHADEERRTRLASDKSFFACERCGDAFRESWARDRHVEKSCPSADSNYTHTIKSE